MSNSKKAANDLNNRIFSATCGALEGVIYNFQVEQRAGFASAKTIISMLTFYKVLCELKEVSDHLTCEAIVKSRSLQKFEKALANTAKLDPGFKKDEEEYQAFKEAIEEFDTLDVNVEYIKNSVLRIWESQSSAN